MKRELASQYEIALTMLKGVVDETEEDTWLYTDEVKEAACILRITLSTTRTSTAVRARKPSNDGKGSRTTVTSFRVPSEQPAAHPASHRPAY